MKYSFGKDFYWGAACSGPQSEGSAGKQAESIWEFDARRVPEKYHAKVSNAVASDFYHNYREDIRLFRQVGLNSYRTSIQWSRVMNDREGTLNPEGVQYYHDLLDELIAAGIEPFVCLFHFDMPMCWMEKGGFENRDTLDAFAQYAEFCFREYGSKVKYWSTFNEPVVIPEQGYLYQVHYPEVSDLKRAVQVAFNVQLASSLAIARFKKLGAAGEIGVILNLTPSYPPQNATQQDKDAAHLADLLFNRSYLDPSVKGAYPEELMDFLRQQNLMPSYQPEDIEVIRANTVDYLGVNYYTPRRVKQRVQPFTGETTLPEQFFDTYTFEGQKINPYRGWEIYEQAMYDIALNIRDNYGNIKWYIAENGMGVEGEELFLDKNGQVQDDYRIDFIKDHLRHLHRGIAEGSNCFGYHLWCGFDSWSWRNAYKNRYGLIRVDIDDHCKTSIKKSGEWFKTLAEASGFEE